MLSIKHYSKTCPGGKKAVDDLSLHVRSGNKYWEDHNEREIF